jgi:hypothetical protein
LSFLDERVASTVFVLSLGVAFRRCNSGSCLTNKPRWSSDLAQPPHPVPWTSTCMDQRDDDDPRLENVNGRVRERPHEHAAHALWETTVLPGRAGQWLLIDSREGCLGLEQEALAESSHTIVVPRGCLGHFGRCRDENFSHDAPTSERELELGHRQS